MRKIWHQQRGDTIVEVLLAMAVIGLVLGAAYGIANRSVAIGRSAQERSEALKYAETQIELLRQYVNEQDIPVGDSVMDKLSTELNLSASEDSACFVVDNASKKIAIEKISESLKTPGDACEFNELYQVTIQCVSGLPNSNSNLIAKGETCDSSAPAIASERKIIVRVVWERLGGGTSFDEDGNRVPNRDSLDLYYRYGG